MRIGSARRCFRAACFSARSFSRFLSRFLNVLIDDLSNAPYVPRNLSSCPDVICANKISVDNYHRYAKCTHMSRELCFLPVSYANNTGVFSGVISRIHRHIIPVVSYYWTK